MSFNYKLAPNTELSSILEMSRDLDGSINLSMRDGLKKCSNCTYIKSLQDFHNNHYYSPDGVQYYCKECCKTLYKRKKNTKLFHQIQDDFLNERGIFI